MAKAGKLDVKDNAAQGIKTRLVLNFPGFERTDSPSQLGRMHHAATKTGSLWGFSVSEPEIDSKKSANYALAKFRTNGGNWNTETRVVQFQWNDIVHKYEEDSFPAGFLKNLGKYMGFFLDGTVSKYRKASLRYWGFTIYPLLLATLVFFAVWIVLAQFVDSLAVEISVSLLVALLFCQWPGSLLYVPLTIADWGFARDMVNQKNPEIADRFREFARTVRREISGAKADEIIIVGHSFGSLWAARALALALEANQNLIKGKNVTFLALGSSMLKIALAKNAGYMRESWKRVMKQPGLFWHEVQTKDDWIAFYKCDPFKQVGMKDIKAKYIISRIRFSKAMKRERYKKMRKSFYVTHRQYILYYDKRVPFDYMIRLFGPFSAREIARDDGLPDRIDNVGNLV